MNENKDLLFTQIVTGSCLGGFVLLSCITAFIKVVHQFFM
ncbi:hypothetical protein BACCIP111899_01628 [Bacillus rhizoplanae]|uniref:DUF4027 domain-containing protein n=1 Tax=Bacillus rhizoplanae TaxID=2880966 RepID=A0ABM8Y9X7_9BACI|nr:hypothetical protein BACCIP111899_01628 [Bacillus rhizoplanae]